MAQVQWASGFRNGCSNWGFFFQIIVGLIRMLTQFSTHLISAFMQPYPLKGAKLLTDLVADPPNLFILVLHPRFQQGFHSVFMAL